MLTNAIVYTFPADKADEAESMLLALSAASLTEPGCTRFDINRSIEDPRTFVLYEEWADQAALDAHYTTAHFQKYGIHGIRKIAETRDGYVTKRIS
jgi:quinol monooxygenase YgiN